MLEDSKDEKTRWVELQIPVTEGRALQGRRLRRSTGNTVVKSEGAAAAVQAEAGRVLQREDDPQGLREGARRSTAAAATWSSPAIPDLAFRDDARTPTATATARAVRRRHPARRRPATAGKAAADRRRDDADAGRQAVLRQPHHLRRQHDDARQRHPPRDAAGRERRVQHRGAEVQRQAAESARLLQAARRARPSTSRRRRAPTTRSTSS